MRATQLIGGLALSAGLVVGVAGAPSFAAGPAAMPWVSPPKITSGVPVQLSSLPPFPCPALPTPGDTILVQVNLSFGPGGAGGEIIDANPDGSWSGPVTFFFSGVGRQTTVSAECLDFNGTSATPYAQYQVRHTQTFGS